MQPGEEIPCGFLVACCDASELFEAQREGIAKSIGDHVDFGREAATRAPRCLVEGVFFWAPALC